MQQRLQTILVADADGLMRWAIAQRLSALGYVIWEASEPARALAHLRSAPDLAIVDVRLLRAHPGELMPALAAFSNGHGVILTTSDLASLPGDIGAARILEKPFDLDVLVDRVSDALRSDTSAL